MLNRIFPIYFFFLCKLLNMDKNMQKYTKTILNLKSIKVKTHLFRTYRVLLKRHLCGITSTERRGQRENKMRKLLFQWHWQHERYKVPNLNYKIIWTFKIVKHADTECTAWTNYHIAVFIVVIFSPSSGWVKIKLFR